MIHRSPRALCSPLLGVLAACTPLDTPSGEGTEIGDEGAGWLCLESSLPVSDAGQPIDALGTTPEALIAASTGTCDSPEASLSLLALTDNMTWFDLEPQTLEDGYRPDGPMPVCTDFLYVPAEVGLLLEDLALETHIAAITYPVGGDTTFRAWARVYQGPSREDPDDDEGGGEEGDGDGAGGSSVSTTQTPRTFVMEEMFFVDLVLDGTRTEAGWALALWWLAESYPEGPDGTVSNHEETLWTGAVAWTE